MSPQNLCANQQRFSCQFLEADFCTEVHARGHEANVNRPPLHPSCAAAGGGRGPATASGSGGLGVSRACGLKFAAAHPERSAVIPPMKRRLITLSTAGNLKISPLSNQHLHHHRIYPVRRPSLDGAGPAVAVAVAAPADSRGEATSQQSQPPPPPSTPARQPHTPSSHMEGVRRELSPRDDLAQQGVFYLEPVSPEPEQPDTPRTGDPRVSFGDGVADAYCGANDTVDNDGISGIGEPVPGGSGVLSTPFLILRPVRANQNGSLDGCSAPVVVSAGGAVYSEALTPVHCTPQQPQPQDGIATAGFETAGVEPAAVNTVPVAATSGAPLLGSLVPVEGHPRERQDRLDSSVQPLLAPELDKSQHQTHQLAQPRQQQLDSSFQRTEAAGTAAAPATSSTTAPILTPVAVGCSAGGPAATGTDHVGGGNNTLIPLDGDDAEDGYATLQADATCTADAAGGLSWTTIEVTVAVRPKSGAAARRVGLGGTVQEVHNGYVRGPACGVFDLTRYLTGRDCVRHCGRWISRSQFEKVGGSTMAKWYRSIRVLPDLEPLGEWLERHDMPVLRGPARRSRKRLAGDSGDEMGAWAGPAQDRTIAPWAAEAGSGGGGIVATAVAEMDTSLPESWANNHMLLQQRHGGSGDDPLMPRFLSTWPLSQPLLRPTAGVSTAADTSGAGPAEHAAAAAVIAGVGAGRDSPTRAADPYGDSQGVVRPQPGPLPTPAESAAMFMAARPCANKSGTALAREEVAAAVAVDDDDNDVRGAAPVWGLADAEAKAPIEVKGVLPPLPPPPPPTKCGLASAPSPPPLSLPVLRARVSGLQLNSPSMGPQSFNSQQTMESARKLSTAALEQSRGLIPQGRQMPPEGMLSGLAGVLPPPPPPPLLKRQRIDEPAQAPVRPRLLLHRTSVGDGHGPEQPYLFAVQAPAGMLYRAGTTSTAATCDAGAVVRMDNIDKAAVLPLCRKVPV